MVLEAHDDEALSVDMITLIDFICAYGQAFGIASDNLHGDNEFSFCELSARRDMTGKAIKELLLKGLAHMGRECQGLHYKISCKGQALCTSLGNDNEYVTEYRALARTAKKQFVGQSELDILALIYHQAKSTIKTGGQHA